MKSPRGSAVGAREATAQHEIEAGQGSSTAKGRVALFQGRARICWDVLKAEGRRGSQATNVRHVEDKAERSRLYVCREGPRSRCVGGTSSVCGMDLAFACFPLFWAGKDAGRRRLGTRCARTKTSVAAMSPPSRRGEEEERAQREAYARQGVRRRRWWWERAGVRWRVSGEAKGLTAQTMCQWQAGNGEGKEGRAA